MSNASPFAAFVLAFLVSPALLAQGAPPEQPVKDGPMLGVSILTPDQQPDLPPGVTLLEPMEGGPSEAAGLKPLDTIVKIDAVEIKSFADLQSLLPTYSVGDTVEVTFHRGTETKTTKVVLGSRKALTEASQKRTLLVGLPMPALSVSEWVNGPFDPASLQGKVVVLHFFEMLCPGSLEYSIPRMTRWAEKYGKFTDFALVGFHSVWELHDRQGPNDFKPWVAGRGIKYPIGIDKLHEVLHRCETLWGYRIVTEQNSLGTPGTVIVDKKGIVRFKKQGDFNEEEATKLIDQLLAEPGK